jgi:hypothetical protein
MTKPVLDRGRVDPIVRGRQCAKLIATDRMHSVAATLGAANMQGGIAAELDLRPF